MEFCRALAYEEESTADSSFSSTRSSSYSSSSDYEQRRKSTSPTLLLRSGTRLDQWLRFVDDEMQWKDVQLRFHWIASPAPSSSISIDAASFAFPIGMEQAPEFAKELLAALRRRKNVSKNITESELQSYWIRITDPCYDSRLQLFFDMCDKDMKGRITKSDLKQMIILSASTNNLALSKEEAECYASLIMQELGAQHTGHIEFYQLKTLLSNVSIKSSGFISSAPYSDKHLYQEPNSMSDILIRTYWRRVWIVGLWLVLCASLFAWKFVQYSNRAGFQVMGYCLTTAKGAAETLKLNMALILLPVCRNTITWMRRNPCISSVIPFNDNINFHKLIAGGIVVGVILHGGTHLACDFPRIAQSNPLTFQLTIGSRFGSIQPSYMQVMCTTEVATGILMVVLMAIAFPLATKMPRRQSPTLPSSIRQVTGYNTFWYSHHLFIFVYILLIIHSFFLFLTSKVAEKTTWMYIAIPVLLYAGERIYRSIRSEIHDVEILEAKMYPGEVLALKLSKPEGFSYRSGMYIYIKCPQVALLEWHPFSLTSGPEDDYLSVHIRTLGDWSYQIYSLVQEADCSVPPCYPRVYIDGPYGAASQDHVKYDVVVLIGLGIGATPFISILKDISSSLHKPSLNQDDVESGDVKGPLKAYLYWVTREQGSLGWFREAMNEISEVTNPKQKVIEMHTYLTSLYQRGDARSVMISVIQELHSSKNGTDIFSQTQVHTHFARPNWYKIFSNLVARHAGQQIGVFYCGTPTLARELERLCIKLSTKTATRFVFHKEN
ncbi:hypothetical protein V2J09_014923 [Rumex salicifolius]